MTNVTSTPAKSAAVFVDSIGINSDATDAQTAKTIADELKYLGIGHLRTDYAPASDVLIAGSEGAKVDEILPHYMYAVATKDIQNFLAQNIDPAASVIEAVEGPNEVQNDPDSYNGVSGPAGIEAMQRDLYSLTKADTALNNASRTTAVFNFSVLQGTPEGTYGGMQSYADFGNVHAYAGSGIPAIWVLPYEVTHNDIAGSDPIVVTETGATTIASSPGVPQDMQARWDIEALLDNTNLGISRTYLYNLTDWNTEPGQSGNFSAYYGMYNADGTPKLAATAIHNLSSLLTSSGAAPAGATLSFSLDGMVNNGQSELFAKANGVFDLALWNDTYYWDATSKTETALGPNTVTLTLTTVYGRIDVYDPLIGTSPVQSVLNASSINVSLSKDPLFIEVTPIVASPTPAPLPQQPDTAPPILAVVESITGLTNLNSVIISGTVSDAQSGVARVEVYDTNGGHQADLGHATIGSNGTWIFNAVGLANGSHQFAATAIDTASNATGQMSAGNPVTVDTVAPQPTIRIITGNRDGGVTLAGVSKANSTVSVTDTSAGKPNSLGSVTTSSTGIWQLTSHVLINMSNINSFSASAVDPAGNMGTMPGRLFLTSSGVDTINGSAGASDVFAIMSNHGSDVINGFETASSSGSLHDYLDFSGRGVTSFGQVQQMMSGTNSAVITLIGGKTITLTGVSSTLLTAADFRFS